MVPTGSLITLYRKKLLNIYNNKGSVYKLSYVYIIITIYKQIKQQVHDSKKVVQVKKMKGS
jgi:hypothetical protein